MALANRPQRKLGEILLERELVSEQQIAQAVTLQQQSGKRLGQVFLENEVLKTAAFFTIGNQFHLFQILQGLH